MSSNRRAIFALVPFAVALLFACTATDATPVPPPSATSAATATEPSTSTAAPIRPAPTPVATAHNPEPRTTATRAPTPVLPFPPANPPITGIAEVDAIVEAVFMKDGKALANAVRYAPLPCAERPGLGAPPTCDSLGVPDGTPVAVLLTLVCDGYYAPPTDAAEFLRVQFGEAAPDVGFAGLYEPTPEQYGDAVAGGADFVVVFRPTEMPNGQPYAPYRALVLNDGRIVVANGGCDAELPSEEWIARWIVSPEEAAWRVALADRPALASIVATVRSGPEALVDLAMTTELPCSVRGEHHTACAELGLPIDGHTDGVVLTPDLYCEFCEMPPIFVERALAHLYRTGSVVYEGFWAGVDDPPTASGPKPEVELFAAWVLDDETAEFIDSRWSNAIKATHVLAFRSTRPNLPDEGATGFVLYVDPTVHPSVAVIGPIGTAWKASRYGDANWQLLFVRE